MEQMLAAMAGNPAAACAGLVAMASLSVGHELRETSFPWLIADLLSMATGAAMLHRRPAARCAVPMRVQGGPLGNPIAVRKL